MFLFSRKLNAHPVEQFDILLEENSLPAAADRFGQAVWCLGYGEPFPRHHQIGKAIVIQVEGGIRLIVMAKDMLPEERVQLVTELQLLIGGLVDVEGYDDIDAPGRGWHYDETFRSGRPG